MHKTIEYFRTFFDVSQAIFSSQSLNNTLKLLIKRTVSALGAQAGSLRLVNEKTHLLELAASYLLSKKYLSKGPLSCDLSIPEVLKGKVVIIKDAFNDPRIQYKAEAMKEGINTILSVPVVSGNKVIGVLRLYSGEPRDFSDKEIEFISALAEIGGLAIANAKIYEDEGIKLSSLLKDVGIKLPEEPARPKQKLKSFALEPADPSRSLEYFRGIHTIAKAILSTLDSQQVIDLVIEIVIAIMKVKACSIRLINETTRELELVASRGLSERYLKKGPLHIDKSIRETLTGTPVLIADARTDPRIEYQPEKSQEGIISILSLPIIARKRVIGILRLYSGEPRRYSREEVAFLSAIAELAGIAIINAQLYERTKYDLSFWKTTLGYLDVGRKKK
ncbi:MAG TPA: GAF domain-containing protein [Syntrophales bacterium]|nr:GAF domain-containing protein [Syntrophales bacterium]